jgi:GNAT superfamily N-acetyltransferase
MWSALIPLAATDGGKALRVVPCGSERAEDVHRLTQEAFKAYAHLDPPSGAVRESVARVRDDLALGGGALAQVDGRPVGCLRWQLAADGDFHVRRVAIEPERQRQGIGRALMAWAEREAVRRGCGTVFVGVRIALPGNVAFYRSLGYAVTGEHSHDGYERTTWLAMRKHLGLGAAGADRCG